MREKEGPEIFPVWSEARGLYKGEEEAGHVDSNKDQQSRDCHHLREGS
jgi:hypothetical protein